jgi:hypothetical protein
MSDLAQWNVHGRVEMLRTEWTEWDQAKNDWQPSTRWTSVRFRPDRQTIGVETFNPDGSLARTACVYNEAGRIVETSLQTNDGPVSRIAASYDGAGRIIRTVNIDEKGVSSEFGGCRSRDRIVRREWRRNHDHRLRRPRPCK